MISPLAIALNGVIFSGITDAVLGFYYIEESELSTELNNYVSKKVGSSTLSSAWKYRYQKDKKSDITVNVRFLSKNLEKNDSITNYCKAISKNSNDIKIKSVSLEKVLTFVPVKIISAVYVKKK